MAEQDVSQAELTKEGSDEDRYSLNQWHVVQRAIFGLDGKPENLYFRWRSIGGDLLARTPPKSHRLSLDAERGVLLNFCTLSNAFYESYWLQYTRILGIAFRITVADGKGWIRLVRIMPRKERVQISMELFDARDAPVTLTLVADRTDPNSTGILFVEIMATEGRLRLSQGAWLALCHRPVILPRFHIGICTYNRARFVKLTLRTLDADEFVSGLIEGILIVSQGDDTQDIIDQITQLTPDFARKIRVIEQMNLGGAGGFARVMYEVSKNEDGACVLMDDDIEIEPESLFRAAGFHTLLREPACVGGQMLELQRPSIAWDSGGKPHHSKLSIANPLQAIDAGRIKGIRRFVRPQECAYNAWWFFLFSTSLIRKYGFPLPLFVSGDDVEYGLRLLRSGNPTITLPGVFIWHQSFYLKNGGPNLYYDVRNFLIIAAIYHDNFSPIEAVKELWARWSDRVLVHDYGRAQLILKAVADFLKGPRALQSADPAKLHQSLTEVSRRYSTVSSARTIISHKARGLEHLAAVRAGQRVAWGSRVSRLVHALHARIPRRSVAMPVVGTRSWNWLAVSTHNYYAVDLGDPTKLLTFARSRRTLARATLSFLWATLQLIVFGRRAQREWNSAFPELAGVQFWERYFR